MQKTRLFILFAILFYNVTTLAHLKAEVDSTRVTLGETFRLNLSSDDAQQKGLPDLTPLQHDFVILGTEQTMSYTVINGQAHSMSQWSILLQPKTAGTLTIPTIKVGQQASQSIQITVQPQAFNTNFPKASALTSSTLLPQNNEPVILKTEITQHHPYVNQQIIYTVKLLARVNLLNTQYQPPQVKNALMTTLGQSRHDRIELHGQWYDVEEQTYAIYPQKSGNLKISSPVIHGLAYSNVPQPFTLRNKTITLIVQPVPSTSNLQNWLPAKQVKLYEYYDELKTTFEQGSTITRTITLVAHGLPAQLLPQITFPSSQQWSHYLDQPQSKTEFKQGELIGSTTLKITYLLNTAGEIALPALKLPWFNTLTQTLEYANLSARPIHVIPNPSGKISSLSDIRPPDIAANPITKTRVDRSSPLSLLPSRQMWIEIGWVTTLLVIILLAFKGFVWGLNHIYKTRTKPRSLLRRLQHACQHNQPLEVRGALLEWARHQWPHANIKSIDDLTRYFDDEVLKQQLYHLSAAIYGKNMTNWSGIELFQAIVHFKTSHKSRNKNHVRGNKSPNHLPPLNP